MAAQLLADALAQHARALWRADSPAVVVTAAIVLFLGALKAADALAHAVGCTKRVAPDAVARRQQPPAGQRACEAAPSLLDTHGTLLQSWTSPVDHLHRQPPGGGPAASAPPPPPPRDIEGWQNLCIVLLMYYVLGGVVAHRHLGSIFADSGVLARYLLGHLGGYVRDCSTLTLLYAACTFGLQAAIATGGGLGPLRHPTVQVAAQAALELALFGGAFAYVFAGAVPAAWPFLQRLFFLAQAAVYVMKAHSYLAVNRRLAAEVALGGPGTGTCGGGGGVAGPASAAAAVAAAAPAGGPTTTTDAATAAEEAAAAAGSLSFAARLSREVTKRLSRGLGAEEVDAAAAATDAAAAAPGLAPASSDTATAMPTDAPLADGVVRTHRAASSRQGATMAHGSGSAPPRLRSVSAAVGAGVEAAAAAAGSPGAPEAAAPAGAPAPPPLAVPPSAPTPLVRYPNNIHARDFLLFTCCPSLCYEPNFLRTSHIRWGYLIEKLALGLVLLTAQAQILTAYIVPLLLRLEHMTTLDAVSALLLPVVGFCVCMFFLIFEVVLNLSAEVTFIADRRHYDDFWNASTFTQFSRQWNRPVHVWLLTHVYRELSRRTSRGAALQLTLYASIVAHELVLWGAFRRVTFPYLGAFSLTQLPLASLMQTSVISGRRLGNVLFWFGLTSGLCLNLVLYARALLPPRA